MAAIDNLTANVAKLSADVDSLLANQGPSEASVQAAADAVAAADAKIVAVLPPPPAPAG